MPNAVLVSLHDQRDEQIAAMDAVLAQVEGRDLVDAERNLLDACRDRIANIDAQIAPLEQYEALRAQHSERVAELPRPNAQPSRALDTPTRDFPYRTPGDFLVDYIRGHGMMDANHARDEAALARITAAYATRADQTTADTPGILPTPIVGGVVNLIDANRPLVTSLGGARPLGGIPGTTFTRPKITQHTQVGKQPAEKQAVPSRKMTIGSVPFAKETYGGSVDISRQDIDWTSPAAWDILVRDLSDVYSEQTETVFAADFKVKATGTSPPALPAVPVLGDWSKALYAAAATSYSAGKRMPDRVWCSLDVWAMLGALVDVARMVFPSDGNNDTAAGSSSLADFRGDVLGLPRIVVPTFPAGTCIVGPSVLYEVYEEVIGLLSVIEPSILGVEVAYGGYVAYGSLHGAAFVPLDVTGVTGLTELADAFAMNGDEADDDEAKPAKANNASK